MLVIIPRHIQDIMIGMKEGSPRPLIELQRLYEQEFDSFMTPLIDDVSREAGLVPRNFVSLGCGYGFDAIALLARFRGRYIGIDHDKGFIKEARETNGNIRNAEYLIGDAREHVLPPESADVVLIRNPRMLGIDRQYIPSAVATWRQIVAQGVALLRPGGILYVGTTEGEEKAMRKMQEFLQEQGIIIKKTAIHRQRNPGLTYIEHDISLGVKRQ